eukprot:Lankesteria_metandrocarpae@DN4944_c0_g1_i2.p1
MQIIILVYFLSSCCIAHCTIIFLIFTSDQQGHYMWLTEPALGAQCTLNELIMIGLQKASAARYCVLLIILLKGISAGGRDSRSGEGEQTVGPHQGEQGSLLSDGTDKLPAGQVLQLQSNSGGPRLQLTTLHTGGEFTGHFRRQEEQTSPGSRKRAVDVEAGTDLKAPCCGGKRIVALLSSALGLTVVLLIVLGIYSYELCQQLP